MSWQTLPYLMPYLISVAISTAAGFYAWQRRAIAGAGPYAWYALAQASWTLGYVFELTSPGLETKIFWDNTQFAGMFVAPMTLFAFALHYTGRKLPHPKRAWGLLAALPIISLLLIFTDGLHGLIRPAAWLVPGEPFSELAYDFTVTFWVMTIYVYGLTLSGCFILIGKFIRTQRLYRVQVGTILIGVLIPMAGSLLTIMGITLTFHRDTTPLTFAIGNLVVAWGLFRYRLFDMVPVARDAVIESMSDAVVVADAHGRVVDLNPAAQALIGRAASEIIGQPAAQVFSRWPGLVEQYRNVEETHTEIVVGAEEEQRHFALSLSPLRDRRGRLTGRLVVVHDITERIRAEGELAKHRDHLEKMVAERTVELTASNERLQREISERKRAEEALRESEERFRTLVENLPVGVFRNTPGAEGEILTANPAFLSMFGFDSEDAFRGTSVADLYANPDERKTFSDNLLAQGSVTGAELRLKKKDGSLFWGSVTVRTVRAESGEVAYFDGIIEDVTKRVQTEKALRESEQKFRRIVEQSNDGIVLTDERGAIIEWNEGQERITGLKRDEVSGRPLWDAQFQVSSEKKNEPAVYQQVKASMLEFFETGQAPWLNRLQETVIQRSDGTHRTVQVVIFSIETDRGFRAASISRDITERKRADDLIRAQRDLALQLGVAVGLEETLRLCTEAAIHSTGMDAGGVYLVDSVSGELNMPFSQGLSPDFVAATSHYDANSPSTRLVMAGQPVYVNYQELGVPLDETRQREGLRTAAILPVHHEGQVIACLNVVSRSLDQMPAAARDTLEMIAAQIGSFVARARAEEGQHQALAEALQATRALRESEQFLQNVFDSIQDGISVLDADLNILQVNAWIEQMYASQTPLQGKKCYAVYQQRESPCPWCPSLPALKTGETHSKIVPYPAEENPAGWIDLSAFPLKDAAGHVVGIIEHVKDITKRKRAEEALRHYAGRLETMREIDQAVLAARSPEEIVQSALRHIRQLVPCRRADVALFDLEAAEATLFAAHVNDTTQMVAGTRIPLENMGDLESLRRGEVRIVEDITDRASFPIPPAMAQILHAEGVRSFVNVPLLAQGELIGTLNVAVAAPGAFSQQHLDFAREVADQLAIAIQNARLHQDVQRHADELAAAVIRLQELDRLKNEFIQNVSHELRTPLALVRGYAELLDDGELGELSPQQQKSVAIITRRTRMLSGLVEDITLILEVESRQPEREPVALDELARAAVEDFRVTAGQAGLTLRAEIGSDLPLVGSEVVYLRRVLDNLLGNAVKFTPSGGTITIQVRSENDQVILQVADTGIGIPPDQQERIFERFYQVNGSASRKYSGVGLGLALVKEIVEASGGQVRVESQEDAGSTFTVTWPAFKAEGAE